MIWARKGFVHFLAGVLFLSLLGTVWSLGFSQNLGKPEKLEKLLSDSKIYDNVVASVLDESQKDDEKNGTGTSVSLSDNVVKQAAEQSFSPQLLESSVNKFIEGNYAWLIGQTPKPVFVIDLGEAKDNFAKRVGTQITTRLAGLPVCTAAEQAQLQIPIDPLTITCRPPNLDPKTEGDRVGQEIANSDFLSQPMVTADTLGKDDANPDKKPYYADLQHAPKLFRLGQKLPLILAVLALVSALAIIAIATTRRRGVRRVAVVLAVAGIILIVTKFIGDWIVDKFDDNSAGTLLNTESLKQPVSDFFHQAQAEVSAYSLYFGMAYVLLAAAMFAFLHRTRDGRPQVSKVTEVRRDPKDTPEPPSGPSGAPNPRDISLSPRREPRSVNITGAGQKPTTAPPLSPTPPKPKKRPRLIQ